MINTTGLSLVEAGRKLLAIDSSVSRGTKEAAVFLDDLAKSMYLHSRIAEESRGGVDQANIIISPAEKITDTSFLLLTHLDTVDPGSYHEWTATRENPSDATISRDRIYGLGAVDAKLDFLCKLFALKELKTKKLKVSPVLVGTYGQFSGMTGVTKFLRNEDRHFECALVGSPTELQIGVGAPGRAIVEILIPFTETERRLREQHDSEESASSQSKIFQGRSAPGSNPQEGDNAIMKMISYAEKLPTGILLLEMDGGLSDSSVPDTAMMEFDLVGEVTDGIIQKIQNIVIALREIENEFVAFQNLAPDLGPSLNIGRVRTIAEGILVSGCCHLTANIPQKTYEKWIERLRFKCREGQSQLRVSDFKHPFRQSTNSEFLNTSLDVAKKTGLPARTLNSDTCTAANVLIRRGINTLIFGPGQGVGNSHAANEHIKISELTLATQFYEQVIQAICL